MRPDRLPEIERAASAAIRSGCWSEAQALLTGYCAEVESRLHGMVPDAPDACRIVTRVQHFLAWANRMALAGRADLAEQIRQLPSLSGYTATASSDHVRSWHIEG